MVNIPMTAQRPFGLNELNREDFGKAQHPQPPLLQQNRRTTPPVQQNFGTPPQQQPPVRQNFGTPPQQQPPVRQNFGTPPPAPVRQPRQRPAGNGVLLKKGQKTSLSRMNANLDLIEVGLGWDLGPGGQAYDLDVEAFLLGPAGQVIGDDWFVFYNQPVSPDGSVRLLGDSATGAGPGDDEIIQVRLRQVNPQVAKITFIVTINEARERGYNFSNVANAYVRIVDKASHTELIRFNLTDYYHTVCSMIVGEVYRYNNEWKFNPVGDGTKDDLLGLCLRYGVHVAG